MLEEMVTHVLASRDELYTDVRLNDTLCGRTMYTWDGIVAMISSAMTRS